MKNVIYTISVWRKCVKNIKVIAREKIINPETKQQYDDAGLKALDGYHEDVISVDEPYDGTAYLQEYVENHPELKGWSFEFAEL